MCYIICLRVWISQKTLLCMSRESWNTSRLNVSKTFIFFALLGWHLYSFAKSRNDDYSHICHYLWHRSLRLPQNNFFILSMVSWSSIECIHKFQQCLFWETEKWHAQSHKHIHTQTHRHTHIHSYIPYSSTQPCQDLFNFCLQSKHSEGEYHIYSVFWKKAILYIYTITWIIWSCFFRCLNSWK